MPIRVSEYIAADTRMLSVVPTDNLWVEANYRKTQTGRVKVGDSARIRFNARDAGAARARPAMSVGNGRPSRSLQRTTPLHPNEAIGSPARSICRRI